MQNPLLYTKVYRGHTLRVYRDVYTPSLREVFSSGSIFVALGYWAHQIGDEAYEYKALGTRLLQLGIPKDEVFQNIGFCGGDEVVLDQDPAGAWVWVDIYSDQHITVLEYSEVGEPNGLIYFPQSKMQGLSVEQARAQLKSELDMLQQWYDGEVYFFTLSDYKGEVIASYGDIYDPCDIQTTLEEFSFVELPTYRKMGGITLVVEGAAVNLYNRGGLVHSFPLDNDWVKGSKVSMDVAEYIFNLLIEQE